MLIGVAAAAFLTPAHAGGESKAGVSSDMGAVPADLEPIAVPAPPSLPTRPATEFEGAVLDEINALRANPAAFAERLQAYRLRFSGLYVLDDAGNPVETTLEGPAAVDEAIAELVRTVPLPPLALGELLALGAADHAAGQGQEGGIGHILAGTGPGDRVTARGGGRFVSEVISYGQQTPFDVVRQLVVDDGVASRGHRFLLLAGEYHFAGVGCGPHRVWQQMCTVKLSGQPDGSPPLPPRR
jgi:uncharacterized protein YkwD